jgi:hypothetical protein
VFIKEGMASPGTANNKYDSCYNFNLTFVSEGNVPLY